jgi:hypothetical protein
MIISALLLICRDPRSTGWHHRRQARKKPTLPDFSNLLNLNGLKLQTAKRHEIRVHLSISCQFAVLGGWIERLWL